MYAFSARLVINAFDKLSRPHMYLQTNEHTEYQTVISVFLTKIISRFSVYDIS